MGWRFRRILTILPGVRLNFGAHGVSLSIGPRGASITIGRRGTHLNAGLPGSGVSWRQRIGMRRSMPQQDQQIHSSEP